MEGGASVTDLVKDVAAVLAPVLAMGDHLSVIEKDTINRACDDVLRICEDEEKAAERMADMMQELEQRLDDAGIDG